MTTKRDNIHSLIEAVPEEGLNELKQFIQKLTIEEAEEELTEETKKNIAEALEEYKRGEYYTFEQVFNDDINEEELTSIIKSGNRAKKWEDVFKDIQELSNGDRIKLLDKMFDTYFGSKPSKEMVEKVKRS